MKSLKTLLVGTTLAGALLMGTTAASADTAYTVQSGDNLSTISQKYSGTSIQEIAEANGISNLNMIFAGEQLTIPTADDATTTAATTTTTTTTAPTTTVEETTSTPATTSAVTEEATTTASTSNSAKEWIAQKESSGSYTATNGRYIGRYQLDSSYLNGDYSAANQEKVADAYVSERYGSWEAAQSFWLANGWY
ncbi:MAG: LysM peptidoglycan-binding domain-containing protein [Enterococcus sp.]